MVLELQAPPVDVDPVFLDEAVTNVVENALKYTPPGAEIRIRAAAIPGEPFVRLTIEDAGPGRRSGAPASPLREVLPGARDRAELALRHGRRAGRRPGAHRGDGRPRRRPGAASSAAWPSTSTCRSRRSRRTLSVDASMKRSSRRQPPARSCSSSRTTRRPARPRPRPGRPWLPRRGGRRRASGARALGDPAAGRRPPRPGAAGHGRPRDRAGDPAGGSHAHRHPVRPVRGAREGRGARARRRRLRHQAVRRGRAPRPPARRAPPRRSDRPPIRAGRVASGRSTFDAARHEVAVDGAPVDLTPREFEILRVLLAHPGRLVTKGRLLRAVWGEAYQGEASYVYVHVSQLRRKLAAADPDGRAPRPHRDRARGRLPRPASTRSRSNR